MKDHGMIFSAPMVRALLEGRKTQTRRLLTPHYVTMVSGGGLGGDPIRTYRPNPDGLALALRIAKGMCHIDNGLWTWHQDNDGEDGDWVRRIWMARIRPKIGDRVWVRETWADDEAFGSVLYRADHASDDPIGNGWRPAIHLPRAKSRITLTITDVRVQKLHEITEEDAQAEGLIKLPASGRYVINQGQQYFGGAMPTARQCYAHLWDSLHGDGKRWMDDPWVIAISFGVSVRNIDAASQIPSNALTKTAGLEPI